jgi:hypothetical protein
METRNRQEQVEFANKLQRDYMPRLAKLDKMMKTSRELNTELKEVKTELKEIDEDLINIMQTKKWKYFTCQEHMHLCLCISKRKRTLNQTQLIEVCTNYLVNQLVPSIENRINTIVSDITKQPQDIKIPINTQDVTFAIEQSINTARSNPMQEKIELKIKKQRPNV